MTTTIIPLSARFLATPPLPPLRAHLSIPHHGALLHQQALRVFTRSSKRQSVTIAMAFDDFSNLPWTLWCKKADTITSEGDGKDAASAWPRRGFLPQAARFYTKIIRTVLP